MSASDSTPSLARKPVSKKRRFEIFKRDSFTCQYCGAQPPAVVLEVDHIHPVAEGGDSDDTNLITACEKCNRGKGKRTLGDKAKRPDADLLWLETQQELVELRRYQLARTERDALEHEVIESLFILWCEEFRTDGAPNNTQMRAWIRTFGADEIDAAISIAAASRATFYTHNQRVRYVAGILWNRKRDM